MNQWAKLHGKLSESEDFMALHAADPNAALLFLMALPQAAPWGVLPANPVLFRARVCPMLDLSLEQVQTCLRLIIDQGMMTAYDDRQGKPLVYITHWNENQSRQWSRVAAPQYDLPPDWTPPAGLAKGLADAAKGRRSLNFSAIAERVQSAEARKSLSQVLDQPGVLEAESKPSLSRVLDQSKTSLTRERDRDRDREERKNNARAREGACAVSEPILELSSEEPPTLPETTEPEPEPEIKASPVRTSKMRKLTPKQEAVQAIWTATGLPGKPSPPPGAKPGYSVVAQTVQSATIQKLAAFAEYCENCGVDPPEQDQWAWFVSFLRAGMTAPGKWGWNELTGALDARASPNGNGRMRTAPEPMEAFETGVVKL